MRIQRRCSLLIGSPVSKACCASPNCNLCPWLHTDCRTVIKPSLVSVGECDSMSRRSGSVKSFMMSRDLARRADAPLSSGFQMRAQRVSIARSGQRSNILAALFLSRVCHSVSQALQELTFFSVGYNWFILTSSRCRTCRAPGEMRRMPVP